MQTIRITSSGHLTSCERVNYNNTAVIYDIVDIDMLDIDFSQVRIFVWRGKHKPSLAKPCPACERALRDLGIKRVFYTGNDSFVNEVYT